MGQGVNMLRRSGRRGEDTHVRESCISQISIPLGLPPAVLSLAWTKLSSGVRGGRQTGAPTTSPL
ncbi:hypothetical protein GJAV_G00065580 [Gymnothorax javanicus]|nr:hypothetical protein GJAV_G00065580 [Gymnothorax javanicus]